ncbi:MAG: DUF4236 domain-containing protein [Candidatus Methylomirabilis sp.]|nr:DUF4236 domain-containing protein [Deltaproteobacteria bacterium]
MAFRFRKSFKLAPGLRVNLSKSGASLSLGGRGASFNVGSRGTRATVGIPGTGLSYTTSSSRPGARKRPADRRQGSSSPEQPAQRLELGFFARLLTPNDEEALVDGMREIACGTVEAARTHLERATHLADGAYLAGMIALGERRFEDAERLMETALAHRATLGFHFRKYGVSSTVRMPITRDLTAVIEAGPRGALLALAESRQALGKHEAAIEPMRELVRAAPMDRVARLSLAEILWSSSRHERPRLHEIVSLTDVQNETPLETALLYYRTLAFKTLDLRDAAIATATTALRRRKDRSQDLLLALRYERALLHEAAGDERRARAEWEKLYAERPDYEDVRKRLGIGG